MSDGDEQNEMTRRGFLRGEFFSWSSSDEDASESDGSNAEGGSESGASENGPETRGPAVDLDAILSRAETIAGVDHSGGRDETPHPSAHEESDDE